jgi:hypothetical protein
MILLPALPNTPLKMREEKIPQSSNNSITNDSAGSGDSLIYIPRGTEPAAERPGLTKEEERITMRLAELFFDIS